MSWTVVFDGWEPAEEGRREALCTLGNGLFGTRGAAPESVADGVHYPGTYAAGCYNRLRDEQGGQVIENESLVNLPNWLDLRFAIEDGPWLDLSSVRVLHHRVRLEPRRGVLVRELRCADPAGRCLLVRQRRLVSMAQPHLAGLHTVLIGENFSGWLRVASGIDGRVANRGVARYRGLSEQHLEVVRTAQPDPCTVLLVARTVQSEIRIAEAARTHIDLDGMEAPVARRLVVEPGRIGHELDIWLRRGEPVGITKIAALATSRDVAISEPSRAVTELVAETSGFDELLCGHERAWERLWRRFDVALRDGTDPITTNWPRLVRLCVFHTLQTVSPNNVDLDAGIPARGLHGEAYRGHVFWDELFVFPMLSLRLPGLVRALLGYRVRRLDAARRAARQSGYTGAMYPWQSGSDGREESQRVHQNPLSGRWLPDVSYLQRHVGLAVAYGMWQYYQVTGDRGFLIEHGAEVMLEIARFFAGLAEHDPVADRYHIRGVMGPDEFHTRYPGAAEPGIDDNAYTNVMAVWLLVRAQEVLELLPANRRAELIELLELEGEELARWRRVSRRMYVPIGADGVISQFAGYRDLAELDWADYRRRYEDLQRLDRILEAEGRRVDEYQVSKQADVLMLFYLLSADELRDLLGRLGYRLAPRDIPATIEYYLARTSHGSTLSAVVHAWVLTRANRAQGLEHFARALHSDVADIQGGTTAEGVHLGAMAGCVDLLQRCFAGLETRNDVLWFNPLWPSRLGRLEFRVQYRDQPLSVSVTGRRVRVAAEPGPGGAIRVGCGDQPHTLRPGQTLCFAASGELVDELVGHERDRRR